MICFALITCVTFVGATARDINYYGSSALSFHIIDLNCNGTEANVLNCSHNNIKQHSCQWYEDAYVICPGNQWYEFHYMSYPILH